MYNAFKFRKDTSETERQNSLPRPLRETNPAKAKRKMDRLSENAKMRREGWINKVDFDSEGAGGKYIS
jgi:hypothetical protein